MQNEEPPKKRRLSNRTNIREQVEQAAILSYDWDGCDGLPLREDVRRWVEYKFCSPTLGPDLDRSLPEPKVELLNDGTIEVEFRSVGRSLLLGFPCEGFITFGQTSERNGEVESAVLGTIKVFEDDRKPFSQIDELFSWLMNDELKLEKMRDRVVANLQKELPRFSKDSPSEPPSVIPFQHPEDQP